MNLKLCICTSFILPAVIWATSTWDGVKDTVTKCLNGTTLVNLDLPSFCNVAAAPSEPSDAMIQSWNRQIITCKALEETMKIKCISHTPPYTLETLCQSIPDFKELNFNYRNSKWISVLMMHLRKDKTACLEMCSDLQDNLNYICSYILGVNQIINNESNGNTEHKMVIPLQFDKNPTLKKDLAQSEYVRLAINDPIKVKEEVFSPPQLAPIRDPGVKSIISQAKFLEKSLQIGPEPVSPNQWAKELEQVPGDFPKLKEVQRAREVILEQDTKVEPKIQKTVPTDNANSSGDEILSGGSKISQFPDAGDKSDLKPIVEKTQEGPPPQPPIPSKINENPEAPLEFDDKMKLPPEQEEYEGIVGDAENNLDDAIIPQPKMMDQNFKSKSVDVKKEPLFEDLETGVFVEAKNSYFYVYFLSVCIMSIVVYLVFCNKKKLLALVIEGRPSTSKRRPNSASYRKLDSNLEEAMTSRPAVCRSQIEY